MIGIGLAVTRQRDGAGAPAIPNPFTEGADTVTLGEGPNNVDALGGDDTVTGGGGNDTIEGGAGADSIAGGDNEDVIFGGDDNDTVLGGTGGDKVDGGAGSDFLYGEGGSDTLVGNYGDDTIFGAGAGDTIYGDNTNGDSPGKDVIFGGTGGDVIFGGGENDTIDGGGSDDVIYGGDGNDTVVYNEPVTITGADGDYTVTTSTQGTDTLFGVEHIETPVAAVDFSAGHLTRASALVGATDAEAEGTLVLWIKRPNLADFDVWNYIMTIGSYVRIRFGNADENADTVSIELSDAAQMGGVIIRETGAPPADTWRCVMASWKQDVSPVAQLYRGDTPAASIIGGDALPIKLNDTPIALFGPSLPFGGCVAQFIFHNKHIDLSVEANRRLIYTAGGKPADVGADGSSIFGEPALICLSEPAATVEINAGSGGDFVQNGTITDCASSPSN